MNASETGQCLDLEVIAAFVEQTLEQEELNKTIHHLRTCRDCRLVAATATALDQEPVPVRRRVAVVAAAVLVVLVGSTSWLLLSRHRARPDPFVQMVSSAPKAARMVEPRLSGFPWAPFQNMMSGNQSTTDEKLTARGTAGRVLRDLKDDRSARGLHAKGVANLLRENAAAAISQLRTSAAASPKDARIWNDLGAALYVYGQSGNELLEALNASRKAIQLDPLMSEPYFNIGLILERIGARPEKIRSAWQEYLRHDSTSPWADEARNRLALYKERN